jgi:phosphohistidine phosphatase
MAAYMEKTAVAPELVLCSTARRTVETLDLVRPAFGDGVTIKYENGLYLAEPRQLLDRLRHVDDAVQRVMMIGHNPGIAQFAAELCASPEDAAAEKLHKRMRDKFSTCALAVVRLPAKAWKDVKPGRGALKDFMRPKDL